MGNALAYIGGVAGGIGGWYAGSWLAGAMAVSGDLVTLVPLAGVVLGGVVGAAFGQSLGDKDAD